MTRILVVDDIAENRYLLEAMLQAYGYEVLSANDGAAALACARTQPPDLIISDILMPVMDGFALCKQWRAEPILRGIPFIFYTATYTDARDEQLAMDLGADRFVIKPQEPQAMHAIVQDVLARGTNHSADSVESARQVDEIVTLREYNEVLVRKLEKKVAELESTREALEQDIRDRQQVEADLRRSNERWQLIFDTEPECVKIVSAACTLEAMNPAGLAMIDAPSLDELPGKPLLDLVVPEHRAAYFAMHQEVLGGRSRRFLFEIIGLKGLRRWLETLQTRLPNADGTVSLLGITRDITEQRRAEKAVVESEQRFRELFEGSPDAIFVEDFQGQVLNVNPAACRLHGLSREELLSKNVRELIPEQHRAVIDRDFPKLLSGELTQIEGYSLHVDGTEVPVELRVSHVVHSGQLALLLHARDITERKQANEELTASRKRLEILSRELIATQESERRHLARELHDEIGQVLTGIKLNLKALQQPTLAPRSSALMKDTIDLVEQTLRQVRGLALDLRPSLLDEIGLVAALRWCLDRQSQRAGFVPQFVADPSVSGASPEINTACFRIVQESLTNIARHAKARHVRVELRQDDQELELLVRDDGIGFDVPDARDRTTHGEFLGLLGMEERVRLIGSQIEIVSAPSQGTTICVRIPLTKMMNDYKTNDDRTPIDE